MILPAKSRGTDTWCDSTKPNSDHASSKYPHLLTGVAKALVHLAIPTGTLGQTVSHAPFTMQVRGAWSAQTVTVKALSGPWAAGTATWNNAPGVRTASVTVTTTALNDGDQVSLDIATLIQPVANGTKWYGLEVTTNSGTFQRLYGFDSGQPAWTLTVETSDVPDPPSSLRPNGGVAALAKPTVVFDPGDITLGAVRVQVDTNNDGTPDADTLWQNATEGQWDLSTLTYTATAGATIRWRAAVQDDSGNQSAFSDWATYIYQPQPVLTLDSPAAGIIWDATTDVLAHISTANLAAYRIRVTGGADRTRIRYDSGKRPASGTSIAFGLPEFNEDGTRVLRDDNNYQINVRAWDTYDREPTPSQPAYVQLWTTVHFNDDATLTPIASISAAQVQATPTIRVTWTRAAAPDSWLVYRGSLLVARLAPADVVSGVSTYSWVDYHAPPLTTHVYSVRAVTTGVGRSAPGPRTSIVTAVEEVWLVRDNGDLAMIAGCDVSQLTQTERRAVYKPLRVPYDVSITTAFEGLNGPLAGGSTGVADSFSQSKTLATLAAIKDTGETVRLVYGDVSVPVEVHDINVRPHPLWQAANDLQAVDFSVNQVGEFEVRVG